MVNKMYSANYRWRFFYYDVMIENIDKKEFKDVEIAFISNNGPILRV